MYLFAHPPPRFPPKPNQAQLAKDHAAIDIAITDVFTGDTNGSARFGRMGLGGFGLTAAQPE